MGWSAPPTFTDATVQKATTWQTGVADNLSYLYANRWDATNFDYSKQAASLAADKTLLVGVADVGVSVTLNRVGTWILIATVDFLCNPITFAEATVRLIVNNVAQTGNLYVLFNAGNRLVCVRQWKYTAGSQPLTAKLDGWAAQGAVICKAPTTRLYAYCCKAP